MQRKFAVMGLRPIEQDVSVFLQVLDLGIDGVFEPFQDILVFTMKPGREGEDSNMIIAAIKTAFEHVGCKELEIWERHV